MPSWHDDHEEHRLLFSSAATSSEVGGPHWRVTEVAPDEVNEHPHDSVVQLHLLVVVTRRTVAGPHRVLGSGFLLKGVGLIEHEAIMTAAHDVSISDRPDTEDPIMLIEMIHMGTQFVVDV